MTGAIFISNILVYDFFTGYEPAGILPEAVLKVVDFS
jgi:hypothetical protein